MKRRILTILADGSFHSGQQLGLQLGISRTAIWKHLQRLQADGIELECVRGRGYRLVSPPDFLNPARIMTGLSESQRRQLGTLEAFETLGSTNQHALDNGTAGYACLAEQQTAGRGRRGRRWESPYGKNIYLSVLYEFAGGAAVLEGLSLAVGLAIVEALEGQGVPGLGLKWPNDICWQNRKVAGILLEMTGDAAGPCRVVVGIGINVHMTSADVEKIDQPWVSLDEIVASTLDRNILVSACLGQLLQVLADYEQSGFAPLLNRWQKRDCLAGEQVVLHMGDRQISGTALGINGHGQIGIRTSLATEYYSGGEVSVRKVR